MLFCLSLDRGVHPLSWQLSIFSGVDGYQCKEWIPSGFSRVKITASSGAIRYAIAQYPCIDAYSFQYNYPAHAVIAEKGL